MKRLGVTLGTDGKLVADGSGGLLPKIYDVLAMQDSGKLTYLCGDKTAQTERRWDVGHDFPYDEASLREAGLQIDTKAVRTVPKQVASREFLEGVFGEDFIDALLKKAGDSEEKIYTIFSADGKFSEFEDIKMVYRHQLDSESRLFEDLLRSRSEDFGSEYRELGKKIYFSMEAYEKCLMLYGLQHRKSLWDVWKVFRDAELCEDLNKANTAGDNFLKELMGCKALLASNNSPMCRHPVLTSFVELRSLLTVSLPRYSELRGMMVLYQKERAKLMEPFVEVRENDTKKELKKEFAEYRNRFAGTEPLMVDIRIYQEHYEDANGVRKLYTEDWKQRIVDLNIELRLTIDTRTRKLLATFCRQKFIVNGQIVTDFGTDGLCVFEGEGSLAEAKQQF